ncbi:right-handed parallel beta-helix repeat-containing protein [Micromonospora peucetia]|uniref:PKD domain-containing protein n=1 Tax=Micromonospora peucetia TaxID=47871 RepID=A0A1C6UTA3_9ACTN|nr:right-handed parallel beta-helix repeat-containing protein [Micromonospora peucetia]WSA34777.1 PKD domain-containing protein [Micromonospora peucetia]SCL57198.1 PKD domain-containing protein [Micromonospora peucetia]
MRKTPLAGLTALALAGTLFGAVTPAHAEEPGTLYVRGTSTACSDGGSGSLEQPFCTIGRAAAVATAGQTVDIGGGNYRERVTIANSGTPERPIVFSATGTATLHGPTSGYVVDGQHDILLRNLRVSGATDLPALDFRDASGITVQGGSFAMAQVSTTPAVRLTAVTRSNLKNVVVSGMALVTGLTMDAASSDVLVSRTTVGTGATNTNGVGIQVDGPRNTILGNVVLGFSRAGVAVGPGAADVEVVNNEVRNGTGYGIHNHGATGTAITNNTVGYNCLGGIRVDGASTGVSVQNNMLTSNGRLGQPHCVGSPPDEGEIGVHGDAVTGTVVDYNNTYHFTSPSGVAYSWNGTRMGLAAFRTASGQAAHDRDTPNPRDRYDSANSAAPGYRPEDRVNAPRVDDPTAPNTGAGPVAYADRGAVETVRTPLARTSVTLDLAAASVTVDATASVPGFTPINSYQFSFGDGTVVTQASPVASHRYANPGEYAVSTRVTGPDGRSNDRTDLVSVLPGTGTVGLLALHNLRYVSPPSQNSTVLGLDQAGLTAAAQFDLADAGSGQVALVSRATGRYVSADTAAVELLTMTRTRVDTTERFTLVRNADGSISLRSVSSGRYVSPLSETSPYLIANQTTVGTSAKFHQVKVTDAARSLRALVNGRLVTAESAGTKPLIANRTATGTSERFDVVDLGNGQVALFARANNRFVTAADGLPLIAGRSTVGSWERFTVVRNREGTVSLKAVANGRYVTAANAGASPLAANRTGIGPAEKFTLR